jgi:hypothetical protein
MPDPFFLALSHEETVLISSVEKEDAPPDWRVQIINALFYSL